MPRSVGHAGALAAIGAYVLAVGPQPSVIRAAVSGAAVSLAWLGGRQRDPWHVLLLAAVHYLLLGGLDHPLAAAYAGESEADPGPLFVDVCLENRDVILELLATQQVNTNEVGRSAAIGPALTVAASRIPGPRGLVDVGCSAGLNLFCDRYRRDYGSAGATGPADAPVQIRCEIVGGSPALTAVLSRVSKVAGSDSTVLISGETGT